ncbi:MAG: hypothetical protein A2521_08225 [Deltaproteobacteria bacterium RIFOXYD12_FULL_57_12]|nr:MAG: hypothetical protein A2521_08225 [Deltaproteobacteria bacterium RIFOXYD12_FULL_57_12]
MQNKPVRDLSLVGDFIRYFTILFVPFFIFGGIWGLIHESFLICGLGYPLLYGFGIALIILLINNDIDSILAVFGLGKKSGPSLAAKHIIAIQNISCLMGREKFGEALKAANALLREEPDFPHVLNMKGQILLEGLGKHAEARICFEEVQRLTQPEDEQYKLADALLVECAIREDG